LPAGHTQSVEIDRNGLEIVDREACFQLLTTRSLGRIGCTSGALPMNFRLVGDVIVVRTGVGTKLHGAADNAVVAFEVDEIDPVAHLGWSVLVTGFSKVVTNQFELEALDVGQVPRWARDGADERVISISTEIVSGRRIVDVAPTDPLASPLG
jgi:uncharacterized protein